MSDHEPASTSTPDPAAGTLEAAEVPERCEQCGTRLETGMVGITDAQIGDEPQLPATTVHETFCPNARCPARKPQVPGAGDSGYAGRPGSLGGDNGGA